MKAIKNFFKRIFINISLALYSLENKLIKNSDVENKSGTGAIEIKKEHKNEVLNKLNRGEKHVEYVDYFYKMLAAMDKVKITSDLYEKYKDNFDQDIEEDDKILEKFLESGGSRRRITKTVNDHYELEKDIKHGYSYDEFIKQESFNFYLEPEDKFDRDLKENIDMVRIRKFYDDNLILEVWFKLKDHIMHNPILKEVKSINHLNYNNTDTYEVMEHLNTYIVDLNIVEVYRGRLKTTI